MARLTDRELLARALKQWEDSGHVDDALDDSTRATARFLWIAVVLVLMALGLSIVDMGQRPKEHTDHAPGTGSDVESPQLDDAKAGREGKDVVHGGMVTAPVRQEYVHGRPA